MLLIRSHKHKEIVVIISKSLKMRCSTKCQSYWRGPTRSLELLGRSKETRKLELEKKRSLLISKSADTENIDSIILIGNLTYHQDQGNRVHHVLYQSNHQVEKSRMGLELGEN